MRFYSLKLCFCTVSFNFITSHFRFECFCKYLAKFWSHSESFKFGISQTWQLTRGMARVRRCFESKISKPTKLDCKSNFYCTVYYITLTSNCEAQRASKNLKKIVEGRVGSQK